MIEELQTLDDYNRLASYLDKLTPTERIDTCRYLCRNDLFFLLWFGCGRIDMGRQWLIDRCREVQKSSNFMLDLWAREHYKSTIITFGKTIQDILSSHGDSPHANWNMIEQTFGIFSSTRPLAKGFLRQIKREFEANELLKKLFPDVLWQNPAREAPKWSEDDGIIVIRKSNPKESTIEGWGVIDGQPTSKHFRNLIYDDLITKENVTTPEMIAKTTEAWELSLNLGSDGGNQRYIGTRYHFNDTYRVIMARGVATPRIYAATEDGTPEGAPVLLEKESLALKRKAMGPYTFSCQMLLNPVADETQGFKREWVRYHHGSDGVGLNKYILVDPANEKKTSSDYTAMMVVGLGQDSNFYILDMVRDRLNLTQRADALFKLHRKWKPLSVGYEKYGLMVDSYYVRERMGKENYHFHLVELGGNRKKLDRIKELIPLFEQYRVYLPESCFKTDYQGKTNDLVDSFLNEEYDAFPVCVHDDMLDCFAYVLHEDMNIVWPRSIPKEDAYRKDTNLRNISAWSS